MFMYMVIFVLVDRSVCLSVCGDFCIVVDRSMCLYVYGDARFVVDRLVSVCIW